MKVLVAGSRGYLLRNFVHAVLDILQESESSPGEPYIDTIISGGASGADRFGESWAKENSIPIDKHPADWDKYGKTAGIIRNKTMINLADIVIVFWDGESKGSLNTIQLALKNRKELHVYP